MEPISIKLFLFLRFIKRFLGFIMIEFLKLRVMIIIVMYWLILANSLQSNCSYITIR